jgi:hypothetical protein
MLVEGMLCVVIAVMSVLHYIERQKLQDRIMSRNLNEYKKIDEPHVKHKSAHDRVMERWKEIK